MSSPGDFFGEQMTLEVTSQIDLLNNLIGTR
jgi:hypothetical protein